MYIWVQGRDIRWAVVKTVTNLQVSYNAARILISWMTVSFSKENFAVGFMEPVLPAVLVL